MGIYHYLDYNPRESDRKTSWSDWLYHIFLEMLNIYFIPWACCAHFGKSLSKTNLPYAHKWILCNAQECVPNHMAYTWKLSYLTNCSSVIYSFGAIVVACPASLVCESLTTRADYKSFWISPLTEKVCDHFEISSLVFWEFLNSIWAGCSDLKTFLSLFA